MARNFRREDDLTEYPEGYIDDSTEYEDYPMKWVEDVKDEIDRLNGELETYISANKEIVDALNYWWGRSKELEKEKETLQLLLKTYEKQIRYQYNWGSAQRDKVIALEKRVKVLEFKEKFEDPKWQGR